MIRLLYNPPDSLKLKTEFLLTRQFFRYASRAYAGRRDINAKDLGWYIPRKKLTPVSLLDSLLINKGKNLSQYEPLNRQYNLLKRLLAKILRSRKNGVWKVIVADKKVISPGILRLPSLKSRRDYYSPGIWQQAIQARLFTDSLVTAIKDSQHRNGLTEDG